MRYKCPSSNCISALTVEKVCHRIVGAGPFPSCGGEMTSTDTLLQSYRVCTRRRSLTG